MHCWCGVRTSSILIFCLYLVLHTFFLIINLIILNSPEDHVDRAIQFIHTNDSRLHDSVFYNKARELILQNSGEYFALPITINLILLVSNLLAAWGALFFLPLLLLPWLALYCAYILFLLSLLIYMIVIIQNVWFKVLLFLVIAPIIVVAFFFWFIVFRFFNDMKRACKPDFHLYPTSQLSTMYTPEPHIWDQPLPIWAIAQPQTIWDPVYLHHLDPRYVNVQHHSPWSRMSSRSRLSEEGRLRGYNQRKKLYNRSESLSLSDKYNSDKQQAEPTYREKKLEPTPQHGLYRENKSSGKSNHRPRDGENNPNYHTSNLEIEIFDKASIGDNPTNQAFSHDVLVSFKDDENYKSPGMRQTSR